MISKVFVVYDTKAAAYLPPFQMRSTAEAVRLFGDTITQGSSPIQKHPEDYSLFEIAKFDDATALFDQYKTHTPLGNGLEYASKEEIE